MLQPYIKPNQCVWLEPFVGFLGVFGLFAWILTVHNKNSQISFLSSSISICSQNKTDVSVMGFWNCLEITPQTKFQTMCDAN